MAHRVSLRAGLEERARAALDAVEGGRLVARALFDEPPPPGARVHVWAVGKAALSMADAAERTLGAACAGGLVVGKRLCLPWVGRKQWSRYHAAAPGFERLLGDHPLPSEHSVNAAEALLERAAALRDGDRALLLLSGGASSLIGAPTGGVTLAELRDTTSALIAGGASIHELNVVRRHLCRLAGGRLASVTRARLDVMALSDVAGDDPATIGSGPASPDPSTLAEAAAIARYYTAPTSVVRALETRIPETPKGGDLFRRVTFRTLANPSSLLAAAAQTFARAGTDPARALAEGQVRTATDLPAAEDDDALAEEPTDVKYRVNHDTRRPPPQVAALAAAVSTNGAPAAAAHPVAPDMAAAPLAAAESGASFEAGGEAAGAVAPSVPAAPGLAPAARAVFARSGLVSGSVEAIAAEVAARARTLAPSEVWIAVGEPLVRVRGGGRGGRAQHLAMEVARRISGCGPSIAFLALGSDGTDGPTFAAGAIVDGTTWPSDAAGRVAADAALARCDSHTWLRDRHLLVITGDTGTNLTDLYVLARGPL